MNQFFEWLANLFRGARFWFVVLPWKRSVRVRLGKGHIAEVLSTRRFDETTVADMARAAVRHLDGNAPGITVEFVKLVDFAAVRTFRLLQDQWRPSTEKDAGL